MATADSPKRIFSLLKSAFGSLISPVYAVLLSQIQRYRNSDLAPLILMSPYLLFMGVFFVLPIIYMLIVSFFTNVSGGTLEAVFTFENYLVIFTTPQYINTLFLTIEISIVTTLLTILISYPIAYFIAFSNWKYTGVLILAAIAPMLVGNVVRAFGWFALLDTNGVVYRLLSIFGIEYTLLNTMPGLIIAISSVMLPYAILILLSNLYSINADLIEAGRSLGGKPLQTFRYITLPLSLPGIVGATLISFVLTMGTFATAVFVGMPQVPMFAPYIYQAATTDLNWPLAAAMSFVLLSISLVIIYVYGRVAGVSSSGQSVRITPISVSDEAETLGRERRFSLSGLFGTLSLDKQLAPNITIGRILLTGLLISAFVFLLIPVIFAILISFSQGLYTFPPETLTLEWYVDIFESQQWISSFLTSFQYSILTTIFALVLSFSAAYSIGRYDFPMKQTVNSATFLPLIIPQVILGLALLIFLDIFGLVGNIWGLTIALAIYVTPYATQALLIAVNEFDYTLEEAAKSLGADEIQTFFRVTVPSLLPGIVSAALLAFIISFANLQIAVFLQGPDTIPVPVRIFAQMQFGATPVIAAVAAVNIAITLLAIVVVERLFGAADALGYSA